MTSYRRIAISTAGALLIMTSGGVAGPVRADTTDHISFAVTLTSVGTGGTASTLLAVPRGLTPVALVGTITPEIPGDGFVVVRAGTSQTRVDAATGGAFTLPVTNSMVDDEMLPVSITNELYRGDDTCAFDTDTRETLADLVLEVTGTESMPRTISEFFSPDVRSIGIVVPNTNRPEVNEAALAATASLADHYDRATTLLVLTATALAAEPHDLDRVVTLTATQAADVSVELSNPGTPTLAISGGGDALVDAAAALGSEDLALADRSIASNLTQEGQSGVQDALTLASLGVAAPSLQGWGRITQFVAISQSAFGSPVDAITIHLQGTHNPTLEGDQVTASVLWNSQLVDAQSLLTDDDYVVDLVIDATQLRRDNGLTIQLDGLPYNGNCEHSVQEARLDINAMASTFTANRGQSLPVGFERFPQTLGQDLPISFGTSDVTSANLTSAGHLVASLQRASIVPLSVQVVDFAQFLSASYSGLVVGANSADADALGASLRFHPWRTVPEAGTTFSVTVDGEFAALEAFSESGRDVLMLGSTAGDDSADLMSTLADYADADPSGWSALSSDLLVGLPGREPLTLSARVIVPQSEVTSEFSRIPVWIAIAAVLVIAAVGTRILVVRKRSRMVAERVAALDDLS